MSRINENEIPQGVFGAMMKVHHYVESTGIEPLLLGLINTRVSMINGCAYCIDMHSKLAVAAGETLQRLVSLPSWRETGYYSEKERVTLAFAEQLTCIGAEQDLDSGYNDLLKHFNKAEIANLALAIAEINAWNRIVRTFGTAPGAYQLPKKINA